MGDKATKEKYESHEIAGRDSGWNYYEQFAGFYSKLLFEKKTITILLENRVAV